MPYKDPEKRREYARSYYSEYDARPENKAKKRAYDDRPDVKERKRKYNARPERQTRRRAVENARVSTPEGRALRMLANARRENRVNDVAYDLEEHRDELVDILRDGRCHDSELPFDLSGAGATVGGKAWNLPSLDRREAGGGYTWDNVRVVLWAVNQMRCDMSIPMFHALCHVLSENLTKRYGTPDLSVLLPYRQNPT